MFLVFDIETTGFKSITDDVVEFSYIKYDNNCRIVKAESLYFYYEGMSWSEEAYEVHQLSKEFLKQFADQFEINCRKMYAVLMYANVCGHNAKTFDVPFVVNWLNRMGLPGLTFRSIEDTMPAFKPITGRAKIKLGELGAFMGITSETIANLATAIFHDEYANKAHNSGYDTMLTGILTVMGYRKGLITFDDKKVEPAVTVNMSLLEGINSNPSKDPNTIIVFVKTDTGELQPKFANLSSGYFTETPTKDEVANYTSLNKVLWDPFVTKVSEGWISCGYNGLYFRLSENTDGSCIINMHSNGIAVPNTLHILPGRDKILETVRNNYEGGGYNV